MIPYFPQPQLHVYGPIWIRAFGTLVAIAVIAGWKMTMRRCGRLGLALDVPNDLLMYVVVAGFAGAHLYSVAAYFPGEAIKDPWLLLKFWEDISSFGGIVGGLIGFWLFFRLKGKRIGPGDRLRYLDVIAFVFPFAWAIGRLGCTVAHDHPGTITTFPLGVSLASPEARAYIAWFYEAAGRLAELPAVEQLSKMAFHDLGWYEFLYTSLFLVPVFLALDRKPRPQGFYIVAFAVLYSPVRFLLDYLRLSDARYAGLTPAQYAAVAVFLAAIAVAVLAWKRGKLQTL